MSGDRGPDRNVADEANALAPLLLGAIQLLDAFVETATETETRSLDEARPAPDDAILAAALGLVSLRRTLKRYRRLAADDYAFSEPAPLGDASSEISLR